MTDREWAAIAAILDKGWKGGLDEPTEAVYRSLLSQYAPQAIVCALRELLRTGQPFLPAVAEIMALIDPPQPAVSFDEAWPELVRLLGRYGSDGAEAGLLAVRDRLGTDVAAWAASYGWERLCLEPVADHEYAGAVVHRLREHYAELTASTPSRERLHARLDYVLAAGGRDGTRELRRVDPLKSLPGPTTKENR